MLFHRFGEFPASLFDTQAAAALAGLESAMSYQRLVRELLGIELTKGETRTDWLRRPLSPAQVEYAAQDVELLLPLYRHLRPRLEESGRLSWLLEESSRLREPARFLPPPEDAYLRLGGLGSLDRRQLAALRALAAWRERQARERDLPRNFVLKEAAMVTMARRQPQELGDLAGVPELPPKQVERYGETLLRLIREARQLRSEEMPAPLPRGARDERGRELVDKLVEAVRLRAEAHRRDADPARQPPRPQAAPRLPRRPPAAAGLGGLALGADRRRPAAAAGRGARKGRLLRHQRGDGAAEMDAMDAMDGRLGTEVGAESFATSALEAPSIASMASVAAIMP